MLRRPVNYAFAYALIILTIRVPLCSYGGSSQLALSSKTPTKVKILDKKVGEEFIIRISHFNMAPPLINTDS